MPINSNIALGIQPVQIENPLNNYAKLMQLQGAQNQNALAQYQLSSAQRNDETANNFLAALRSSGGDPAKMEQAYTMAGKGKEFQEILKSKADVGKIGAETGKLNSEVLKQRMELSKEGLAGVTTPEQYLAWHEANHRDPVLSQYFASRGVTQDDARNQINQALQTPGGFEQMLNNSKLGLEKAMENQFTSQDTGGGGRVISTPKYGQGPAAVVPGSTFTKTVTPGEALSAATTRRGQNMVDRRSQQTLEQGKVPSGYRLAADGRSLEAIPGGPADTSVNPKTLTESQGAATAYGMRMSEANKVLTEMENSGTKNTGKIREGVSGIVGAVPLIGDALGKGSDNIFNALPSVMGGLNEDQQKTLQARINFITAVLRKESGASISASEFQTAEKNYFPSSGDSAAVLKQKQKARDTAIKTMEIQAGPGAKNIQQHRASLSDGVDATNPLLK